MNKHSKQFLTDLLFDEEQAAFAACILPKRCEHESSICALNFSTQYQITCLDCGAMEVLPAVMSAFTLLDDARNVLENMLKDECYV